MITLTCKTNDKTTAEVTLKTDAFWTKFYEVRLYNGEWLVAVKRYELSKDANEEAYNWASEH